ncbi:MAG TPA: divergent polysaccharide deacetylase family protein [Methylomusa anaerophila]|uniref:Divergent polysaccharide deacetylase n=1 Tax=Methylomusa anaerophila TaxID=1930071 RepID=A0A348AMR9_9FIRM|nr:divergent polysaccharide deacetylase family protein [Methylomusa anaerophila]BBB92367.1 divergent polysaccharide deacetylase [Methylomusa anaerophila]HML89994.1 divergent polysaccharide deacetylase family protein [Methylomusa anaerophila]
MKSNNKVKWILVAGIILIAILHYLLPKAPDRTPVSQPVPNIEKTGAGIIVDFTEEANRIHGAVDTALAQEKITPKDIREANREVARTTVEGKIRWHSRQILLSFPADGNESIDILEQSVRKLIKDAGGQVLGTEPDNYQGLPAVRWDIGIKDKLDNDPLTIVTDRLYIAREKAAAAPVDRPKAKVEGKRGDLAIIIDDFGYTREPIAAFAEMDRPITFSVLPNQIFSNEAASKALASGHLVMLHLPLEPSSPTEKQEPATITANMSDDQIRRTVDRAVAAVPGVKGVNNHQGSKATADKRVMKTVMEVLKSHSLFFIDSRTGSHTIAAATAHDAGLKIGENELFLDNSSDVTYIKNQLRTAGNIAVRNGSAIVIGHARMNTAVAIREMIPELEAEGVRLVYASQLLE